MNNAVRKFAFLPVLVLLAGLAGVPAYAADDAQMVKSAIAEHTQAEPGAHTFLSVPFGGGSALVAKANLQSGKTYLRVG